MESDKMVRKPKQKRSINTKEKILEAALKLFCEEGYYKTTTNEIAKVAEISIGSLYSYFKDKDAIFLEILGRYNEMFNNAFNESAEDMSFYKSDKKAWLRKLIEEMIKIHELSKEFNKEIKIMAYSRPEVAAISKKHRELSKKRTLTYLNQCKENIKVKDIEAAAIVSFTLINSIVDHIVFEENEIDRERIIETTVEGLYKLLMFDE